MKKNIVLLLVIIQLLIPIRLVFANEERDLEELSQAIARDDFSVIEASLSTKKVDPNKIYSWTDASKSPSLKTTQLLLGNGKKSLSTQRLFHFFSTAPDTQYSPDQLASIQLALKYYASNPYFGCLLKPRVSEQLLGEKILSGDTLLQLTLSHHQWARLYSDPEVMKEKDEQEENWQRTLVKLAISIGADLRAIGPFEIVSVFGSAPASAISINQTLLFKKAGRYLSAEGLNTQDKAMGKQLIGKDGLCHGLVTYRFCLRLLDRLEGGNTHNDHFKKMKHTIATLDPKTILSSNEYEDIRRFCRLIMRLSFPWETDAAISQHDVRGSVDLTIQEGLLPSTVKGKNLSSYIKTNLRTKYTITLPFSQEQLADWIKNVVREGEWIYIFHHSHVTGLYKCGNVYCFDDPNNGKGEYYDESPLGIAREISVSYAFFEHDYDPIPVLGIVVMGFDNEYRHFINHSPVKILKIDSTINNSKRFLAAHKAAEIGCGDSLNFFLDSLNPKESIENLNMPIDLALIGSAALFGNDNIVKELKRRAILQQSSLNQVLMFMSGYFDCTAPIRVLTENGAEIGYKDPQTGKTARMIAKEKGNTRIAEYLIITPMDFYETSYGTIDDYRL